MAEWTCKRVNRNNELSYSKIDHCLSNNLRIITDPIPKSSTLSDHKGFSIKTKYNLASKRLTTKIPNKNIAKKIMKEILMKERPTMAHYNEIAKKYKNERATYFKTRTKFSDRFFKLINDCDDIDSVKKKLKNHYEKSIKQIEKLRFSTRSREDFKLMNNLSKKTGQKSMNNLFINKLKVDHSDEIITNNETINELICNAFKNKHKIQSSKKREETLKFPTLRTLRPKK